MSIKRIENLATTEIPVVEAKFVPCKCARCCTRHVSVRCPYCRRCHFHGIPPRTRLPTHRLADCGRGGYMVTLRSRGKSA